ncbi:carbohydrate ABC transporter permease [Rubrimonas sp.]|uniref:carbohydrate ABC transporter permease n=1 Tax=Rubrimonas sp. TaxID=2036015 RepID=UPI002FDDA892
MAQSLDKYTKGWWFILPGLAVMVAIVGVPLGMAVRYSLHDVFLYDFRNQVFVGLENYQRAFADPLFNRALRVTALFTLGNMALAIVFGVLVAFLLNGKLVRGRRTWLALFLVPFVMTPVVGGIAWRLFMWQPGTGLVNALATALGGPDTFWLLEPDLALLAVTLTNAWHLTPLAVLVFYAALTTIPEELYESATIDGAGALRTLWHVVLPLLRPHMLFVSIIVMTSAFREFDMIWALTGGGPGRTTTTLSILAYNRGVANQDMGMANTIAFTMFLIMATVAWLYITIWRRQEARA